MLGEQWHKSTTSHTNGCLEARWVKATASHENACVEVAHNADEGIVLVRDSKHPGGGVVAFTPVEWASLLTDVAAGHFRWSRFHPLLFDPTERAAFEAGVKAGEFDLPAEAEKVAR